MDGGLDSSRASPKYRADPRRRRALSSAAAVRVEVVVEDKTVKRDSETDGTTLNVLCILERRAGLVRFTQTDGVCVYKLARAH